MQNPCTKCHKRNNCLTDCYPRKDYLRGIRKPKKKPKTKETKREYDIVWSEIT